ncbi:MAG: NAD-binding protein [Acidobacteriota bacterium]|nr:NAD-binding protein [Acidobacteriota bacterium]
MSERIEEELDAAFVVGNGAHQAVLERANVDRAELFIAASSSEEANLVASVIARNLGAKRCVVRIDTSEDLTVYRRSYERLFGADLLLSPQSLATNAILNIVLGHHTHEVDYLARGRFELRTIQVQIGSTVARLPRTRASSATSMESTSCRFRGRTFRRRPATWPWSCAAPSRRTKWKSSSRRGSSIPVPWRSRAAARRRWRWSRRCGTK